MTFSAIVPPEIPARRHPLVRVERRDGQGHRRTGPSGSSVRDQSGPRCRTLFAGCPAGHAFKREAPRSSSPLLYRLDGYTASMPEYLEELDAGSRYNIAILSPAVPYPNGHNRPSGGKAGRDRGDHPQGSAKASGDLLTEDQRRSKKEEVRDGGTKARRIRIRGRNRTSRNRSKMRILSL